ncbi:MAG: hypothetical protein AUG44_03445 [Actinobacteria bacterium 13_1_20CM_3_71_11]|nr:MAG: hypothetical protein AUG44_03445 [Actinobacteria bacterium 13_1_20CM_3_71_11]
MASGGDFLTLAAGEIGKPYVYGEQGPNAFDCSGLVAWAAAQLGISLPHNAAEQQRVTTPVNTPAIGDLVFFGDPAYHVGIYAGGGQMISAPHAGANVHLGPVGTATGYGRVKGLGGISGTVATLTAAGGGLGAHAKDVVYELAFLGLGAALLGYGLWRSLDPGTRASIRTRTRLT